MIYTNVQVGNADIKFVTNLAKNHGMYSRAVLHGWQAAIDETFRTAGFRHWDDTTKQTKSKRRHGKGYYKKARSAGIHANRNIMVWTGRLRDTLAGRKVRKPRQETGIRITSRLSYAGNALDARPIDEDPVFAKLKAVMRRAIRQRLKLSIEKRINIKDVK